jgi:hypothetical protein
LWRKLEKYTRHYGRKSSFPAAKIVLLIAVAKTSAGTSVTEGSSKLTDFGNSSPGHMPKHITNLENFNAVCKVKTGSWNEGFKNAGLLPLLSESILKLQT